MLKSVSAAKDALYIEAQQGGISHILRIPYGQTAAKPLPLPFAGAVEGFSTDVQNDGALMRLAGLDARRRSGTPTIPTADKLTNTDLEPLNPDRFLRHHLRRSHRARAPTARRFRFPSSTGRTSR